MESGRDVDPGKSELPAELPGPPELPKDLAETFRLNTQILRYIHDSHARLVKVLERADRSEMVIQSSEALNKTFRRLQESQDELAQQLVAARKLRPRALVFAGLIGAALVLVATWVLLQAGTFDRATAIARDNAQVERLVASSDKLLDTIDRGLAANRVLQNENVAQKQELSALKDRVGALDAAQAAIGARADELTTENQRLSKELDAAKEQLVAKDLATTELTKLIDERMAELKEREAAAAAAAATSTAPADSAPTAPTGTGSPLAPDAPTAIAAPDSTAPTTIPAKPIDPALETGVVGAMNRLLADSGVVDLRVLRASGVEAGALRAVTIEVRTAEGFPIGFHQAAACRLRRELDGGGVLALENGESVVRGVRTPFPGGRLDIKIAALAETAASAPELAGLLAPTAPVAAAPEPAITPARPAPDPRAATRLLNAELRSAGYGAYEFSAIGALSGSKLVDVELHHYRGDGALQKTVVAKECEVAVDAARKTVTLVFRDGKHVTKGRDVPFFRAAGESVSSWALELDRADPARWNGLIDQISQL